VRAASMARAAASPPPHAEVALSVYQLNNAGALNAVTETVGLGGAYHVGLEVYWLEWSFGWNAHGSGVHLVHVGASRQGTFKERIPLGRTPLLPCEVIALLAEMRRLWLGSEYDLLRRNCGHFCAELARKLRVQEVPAWVNSLAATGDWLSQLIGTVVGLSGEPAAPSKPVASIPGLWSLDPQKKGPVTDSEEETEADDNYSSAESCNVSSDAGEDRGVDAWVPLADLADSPELMKLELEWRWAKEYIFERLWLEERAQRARQLMRALTRTGVLSPFKRWAAAAPPRVHLPRRSKSIQL